MNSSPAGVKFDGIISLANDKPVVSAPEGSTVHVYNDAHIVVDEAGVYFKLVISLKRNMNDFIYLLFCKNLHKRSMLILKSVG